MSKKNKTKGTKTKKVTAKRPVSKGLSKEYRFYLLGLVVLTFIAFFPSLQNGFTNWDDPVYVTENSFIFNANWGALISEPFSLNYHPLTMLSLGINYQISGLEPFGYHLTNLLLHLINTVLVFLFIQRLAPKSSIFVPFFTALVFGIHPMHVESVAWISERKDVLYVLFFLAGLITYLRYRQNQENKWLIITLVLFLLSLLSKAMAVVFPVILVLIDWYQGRKNDQKAWLEKVPFFALSLFFGGLAYKIQSGGAITGFATISFFERIIFAAYGFCMYLVKALVPVQLSAYYPYPDLQAASLPAFYYLCPLLGGALLVGALWLSKKNRVPLFGLGFYLITVALVLQFISVGKAIMADRYTYLPYIGVFFLIFHFAFALTERNANWKKPITGGVIAFSLLLMVLTFQRNKVWQDSETLWTDVIQKFPERADEGYVNRGSFRGKSGRIDDAIVDLQKAIAVNPTMAKAHESMGNAYGSKGQMEQSLQAFSKAIELEPDNANYYLNRAISYAMMQKFDQSLQDFEQAIQLQPSGSQLAAIYANRGILYLNQNNIKGAETDCNKALQLSSNQPTANFCMAKVFAAQNQKAQALQYAQKAKKLGFQVPDEFLNQLSQ
ncbi:MAG: O-GlcNAc transferase [Saprospiraceae bacterium]|nr:MAG: O-GlcNAc transferase [Saprospiraceae bacterium]